MSTHEPLPPHLESLGRQLVAAAGELQSSRPHSRGDRFGRSRASGIVTRTRVVIALAVAAVLVTVGALLPSGSQDGGPSSAFAAPLVRFAQASPLVLMPLPGWHVVDANEDVGGTGEINFVQGRVSGASRVDDEPAGTSPYREATIAGRVASLDWTPLDSSEREYLATGHEAIPTGLGATVRRLVTEGRGKGWLDISAFMAYGARVLRFRATVTNIAMLRSELLALTSVTVTTFLQAMPSSVIAAADSHQAIGKMLKGIPLPPGFDPSEIRGGNLIRDRYQLGAAVTGTIACTWIRDWQQARQDGNTSMVKEAIAAMATSPNWPVLQQMAKQGGWTQVLTMYAKAMPNGTLFGRPLVDDVESGLGCSEWGINLGPLPKAQTPTLKELYPAGPPASQ